MRRYTLLLLSAALIALGGMSYGLKETVSHHYGAFAERFPQANPLWWNPALSWQQKYEGGIQAQGSAFWGSTTVLVFVTDAYHLFGELERVFTRCGFVVLALAAWRINLPALFASMGCGWFVWAAGFHLIYTLIF
jgi:hypothetical protein